MFPYYTLITGPILIALECTESYSENSFNLNNYKGIYAIRTNYRSKY